MKSFYTTAPADNKARISISLFCTLVFGIIILVLSCSSKDDSSPVSSQLEPPVVADIPDQNIIEGNAFTYITLDQYVDDPDNAKSEITWRVEGNTELEVSINYNRIASIITPSLDWNGSETITFIATDPNSGTSNNQAVFTVTPVNDPPSVTVSNQTIYEGESFSTINLCSCTIDPDNNSSEITWDFSGNSELTVVLDGNNRVNISVLDPLWIGSDTIFFRATDPNGLWGEDTSIFTVNPIIYTPASIDDWPVSTPEEQNLDPDLVKALYHDAINLNREFEEHLYSVLVIKDGYLVAEKYYDGKTYNTSTPTASVTKSYTSVLTGIALHQDNSLSSLDQYLYEFFPEYYRLSTDSLKSEITIRQMLKMRSGYPWEEREDYIDDFANTTNWLSLLDDFPLTHDPGTTYGYSNLTAHTLAVITARATESQLAIFARNYLFDPIEVTPGFWPRDAQGNNVGHGDMRSRPRDMAKFGNLILNDGLYNGNQVVPAEWIAESTQPYSFNIFGEEILNSFQQINYGYCWYSAMCGDHSVIFAWGHGGQLIVIVEDLNMIVVTTADNLANDFTAYSWIKESSILDMVGFFIGSIPN